MVIWHYSSKPLCISNSAFYDISIDPFDDFFSCKTFPSCLTPLGKSPMTLRVLFLWHQWPFSCNIEGHFPMILKALFLWHWGSFSYDIEGPFPMILRVLSYDIECPFPMTLRVLFLWPWGPFPLWHHLGLPFYPIIARPFHVKPICECQTNINIIFLRYIVTIYYNNFTLFD